MKFFPYEPRPHQSDTVAAVEQAADAGHDLVIEAPTGSGKTITLLAGALAAAQKSGRAVLYTTRTNSQQKQAVLEARRIQEHTRLPIRVHALQGRNHLCLKLEDLDEPEWQGASPDDLSHYCSHAKRRADEDADDPRACRWWAGLTQLDDAGLAGAFGPEARTAEEVKDLGRARGLCPYEATKRLMAGADLVVVPYIYVFEPNLRRRLFEWMGRRPDEVVLVVDEAHNLPDYVRGLFSPRLTRRRLRNALKEAGDLSDPHVLETTTASALLNHLATALDACVEAFCGEDDGFVPPFELEARLMEALQSTSHRILEAARNLAALGEVVKDRKRLLGRVPRSHLAAVAGFLDAWLDHDEETSLKLVGRDPDAYLESFLVDATGPCGFLHELWSSIHASGTLAPLEEYRTTLGLSAATRLIVSPDPFGGRDLTILATRGLTTRYESLKQDPSLVDRLQETTRRLAAVTPVKTAVFFPSHDLMQQFVEVGVFDDLPTPALHEERGMPQERLMQLIADHRAGQGPRVLTGVLGGRLSEGIDYPGRDLEAVLVVGTPYPKPSAHQRALLQYYDRRTGHGWDYAVTAPALRRLRQAIGRIRRSADDQGIVVLVDERSAPLLRRAGYVVDVVAPGEAVERLQKWDPDTFKAEPRMGR